MGGAILEPSPQAERPQVMFGPPKDVEGQCNARLCIGDDYGDNEATMRCQLSPGHADTHREEFKNCNGPVVVRWHGDAREEDDA